MRKRLPKKHFRMKDSSKMFASGNCGSESLNAAIKLTDKNKIASSSSYGAKMKSKTIAAAIDTAKRLPGVKITNTSNAAIQRGEKIGSFDRLIFKCKLSLLDDKG